MDPFVGTPPSVQAEFSRRMEKIEWCRSFPTPNFLEVLHWPALDVNLTWALVDCLDGVGRSPDFLANKQAAEDESLIAMHARELTALLERSSHGGGWRHVWDDEYEAIQSSVDVDELVEGLETLAQNATERLFQFSSAKTCGIHPRSGKVKYFYWMSLIAFWKCVLGREVKTSDNGKNRPSGPLVAFVETMSFGMRGTSATPGAIRKFVERHREEVDRFAKTFFPPRFFMLDHLVSGR